MAPDTTNNSPLVSVVMCTYNGEKFLREQIDSILAQTWSNLELVIADDASKDNTIKILEEYARKDPRVRYVVNEKNKGYNKNFEFAFSLAKSDLIAISDQDDLWEPNKIEVMMNNWRPGAMMIYSLTGRLYNESNTRRGPANVHYSELDHIHQHVFNSPIHGHACMLKKELITIASPFPDNIFYDAWLGMYAVSLGTVGYVPHTLSWHRIHEMNYSRDIMSISDTEERNRKLREQMIYFIETFCRQGVGKKEEIDSILKYAAILKTMNGKKFSWPMFRYAMKNRKLIFHYKKKKPFVFISYLKHAIRMARKGLL